MEGNSRRDFLKKAGLAAWTVPAVQVVNMTGAFAGDVNTSVTTTNPPTTPPPPPCREEVCYRVKWDVDSQSWETGVGAQDCLEAGECTEVLGSVLAEIEGDSETVTVKLKSDDCEIVKAYHKAGSAQQGEQCFEGEIGGDGSYASFTKGEHGISHIELIIVCCAEEA